VAGKIASLSFSVTMPHGRSGVFVADGDAGLVCARGACIATQANGEPCCKQPRGMPEARLQLRLLFDRLQKLPTGRSQIHHDGWGREKIRMLQNHDSPLSRARRAMLSTQRSESVAVYRARIHLPVRGSKAKRVWLDGGHRLDA
jgi:hypothetical protein